MRSQVMVQAPGESLAKARQASVTIHSSPGPNQICKMGCVCASAASNASARRAVIHNPFCGVEAKTPQGIVNNCGEPIRNEAIEMGSARALACGFPRPRGKQREAPRAHLSVTRACPVPTGEGAGRNTRGRVCSPNRTVSARQHFGVRQSSAALGAASGKAPEDWRTPKPGDQVKWLWRTPGSSGK
jgi:hypothetical protein